MSKAAQVLPADQDNRNVIVRNLDETLLVEAAAGTGKTTNMIARMVALLRQGRAKVESIAAVTFTRKAAAEIRARFQVELERATAEAKGATRTRLQRNLERVEHCFIGTIHAFCARLLRERPVEANVDVAFEELDEDADWRLREQAWQEHVNQLIASDSEVVEELEEIGLRLWHHTRHQDPVVEELEELGLEVAQLGPAFMKIAEYPDVDRWPTATVPRPDLSPAVDRLTDYVNHMTALKDQLPAPNRRDKLSEKYRSVPRMARSRDLNRPFHLVEILEEFSELTTRNVIQRDWSKGQARTELEKWNCFAREVAVPLVRQWREHCYEPSIRAILPAVEIYARLRRENNLLNFSDLLLHSAKLLTGQPKIREYFRRRFTHLLVDEFQDTDPVQAEIMLLLTADDPAETDWRNCRPVPGSLFVVGDPKQSIYRFRRADIVTYNQVRSIIEETGRVLPLDTNFRTDPPVIDWINQAFNGSFPQESTEFAPQHHPLHAGREPCADGDLVGVQRFDVPDHQRDKDSIADQDAEAIAKTIRYALNRGYTVPRTTAQLEAGVTPQAQPGDFLVLTQKREKLGTYGQKLQAYGIPHQVTGSSSVKEIPELSLLYRCLRAVTRPDDPVALVAVLRSELFGVSDQALYQFFTRGGQFSYNSPIPKGMQDVHRKPLEDSFAKLKQCDTWLNRLPLAAALQKMSGFLGLIASAAIGEEGAVSAGGFVKTIELLRAAANRIGSTAADVVDQLELILSGQESHDAIGVLPHAQAPVRVMNVHQAKGLEAPVVFLAYPCGQTTYPAALYVDRSGNEVEGYMMIQGQERNWKRRILAQPPGWEKMASMEQEFQSAEEVRLRYVAATRVGSQLTISQRDSYSFMNPWKFFALPLKKGGELKVPVDDLEPPPSPEETVPMSEPSAAAAQIAERWDQISKPTYEVSAAKETLLADSNKPRGARESAAQWGTVIHVLLEAAMGRPQTDLKSLAISTLADQGLELDLADEAINTVKSVSRSELWKRALKAPLQMVEVPFELVDGSGAVPKTTRGVIDLAFKDLGGWVLVDYKTEKIKVDQAAELADYYKPQLCSYRDAWESITGEAVRELGIFLTHANHYQTVEQAATSLNR